jgi:CrcB protein
MPDHDLPVDPDRDERQASGGRRRSEASVVVAIAAGGALGAPARYGLAQLIPVAPDGFPWATFWTNVSGSFALGLVMVLILERFPPSRYARPFVAVGFLGAYTTYSTFAVETDLLVKDGHPLTALTYALGTVVAGCLAVFGGMRTAWAVPLSGRGVRG